MQAQPPNNANIIGDPIPEEELVILATVDSIAIQSAIQWWEENASPDWRDVLDKQPVDE